MWSSIRRAAYFNLSSNGEVIFLKGRVIVLDYGSEIIVGGRYH